MSRQLKGAIAAKPVCQTNLAGTLGACGPEIELAIGTVVKAGAHRRVALWTVEWKRVPQEEVKDEAGHKIGRHENHD
jgi:hypothetical protein